MIEYSDKIKQAALEDYKNSVKIKTICKRYKINPPRLYKWKDEAGISNVTGLTTMRRRLPNATTMTLTTNPRPAHAMVAAENTRLKVIIAELYMKLDGLKK